MTAHKVGLRIDVDTFRGTRLGVPRLLSVLNKYGISASFFFCVGPDNMGRHLWRLLRPSFAWKMLRTKAASLYGWDILFKGTFYSGPSIGRKLGSIIKEAHSAGHEIGLHAWDHHAWQAEVDNWDTEQVDLALHQGVDMLGEIVGQAPTCSAVPGWKCTDRVLLSKEKFGFKYNSDCRGNFLFLPQVETDILNTPQIPVTLPTYDEVLGKNGIDNNNYNEFLLSKIEEQKDGLSVLTIHAEAEGIACVEMFDDFLCRSREQGFEFVTLGSLLPENRKLPLACIEQAPFPGREGVLACVQT